MRCFTPQYFNSNSQIGVRQSYMPVNGSLADGYLFESFLPFVICALASQGGTAPNGTPGSAIITLKTNIEQAAFPNQLLVQSMMQANRSDTSENSSGFLRYDPNTDYGLDYSKYYKRNMQDPGLFQVNFGAFIMPAFLMEGFWDDVSIFEGLATYDNLITTKFCEMVNRLFTETDLRLWYPPGKYTIVGTAAPGPNTDSYFANFNASFGGLAENDEEGLIIAQIKSLE
jgi:hypothetical protein